MTKETGERPKDDKTDNTATQPQPTASVREENPAEKTRPGDERLDMDRTPGEGSLQGSTPAGVTVKELLERAEDADDQAQPGTG